MEIKSQKELAFLYDLYVATDWAERFAALVDEQVKLPKQGRALYVATGTAGHALALDGREEELRLVCVDENPECLEIAQAKAIALHQEADFQREDLEALSFKDDEFDLVLGDASLTAPVRVKAMLAEMVRVAKPGARVAAWFPTAASFGEVFSIYWEALTRAGLGDHSAAVENLIKEIPTIANVESWADQMGLESITTTTAVEEFTFDSGEAFMSSPLITDFLLPNWFQRVPQGDQDRVIQELTGIIDEERHDAEFLLTLKATLVVGKKARVQ
ncbi:MAG TPA: class I SAM-dependent methyltransferase [Pyrinomonadaceae bacterium]|nr:class I SAM-dependent methyltransferase [Pyrinomonadaceae bacterium]